jgi:UDP-N-acetylglucosamine 4-epimerase
MFDYSKLNKNLIFLVTGCAGFIGSHLSEILIKHGYKVIGIDDFSNGFIDNLSEILNHPNFKFIKGDIRNFELCLEISEGVDYVLHQAAWGSVPRSINQPLIYEEVNIKGTLNIFESARLNNVKKVIYASSSSVYGDSPILPKNEGSEGQVLSPYALTKKVNEDYGSLYFNLYGLETIGLRYFNVFGPRQNPDGDYAAVIPKFSKLILNNQDITIYGDGTQSRDFTYIDNVIEANLNACVAPLKSSGRAYNIAYGEQITLNEVISLMSKFFDQSSIAPIFKETRMGDIKHSHADISNAKKFLNYRPSINFSQGLKNYIKTLESKS